MELPFTNGKKRCLQEGRHRFHVAAHVGSNNEELVITTTTITITSSSTLSQRRPRRGNKNRSTRAHSEVGRSRLANEAAAFHLSDLHGQQPGRASGPFLIKAAAQVKLSTKPLLREHLPLCCNEALSRTRATRSIDELLLCLAGLERTNRCVLPSESSELLASRRASRCLLTLCPAFSSWFRSTA